MVASTSGPPPRPYRFYPPNQPPFTVAYHPSYGGPPPPSQRGLGVLLHIACLPLVPPGRWISRSTIADKFYRLLENGVASRCEEFFYHNNAHFSAEI
jgi:hypothetical protein